LPGRYLSDLRHGSVAVRESISYERLLLLAVSDRLGIGASAVLSPLLELPHAIAVAPEFEAADVLLMLARPHVDLVYDKDVVMEAA